LYHVVAGACTIVDACNVGQSEKCQPIITYFSILEVYGVAATSAVILTNYLDQQYRFGSILSFL
jgi:hypothetical protein